MKFPNSGSFLRPWPLLGLAALCLVLAATVAVMSAGPAEADRTSKFPTRPTGLQTTNEQGSPDVSADWDDMDGPADRYEDFVKSFRAPEERPGPGSSSTTSSAIRKATRSTYPGVRSARTTPIWP